MNIHYLKLSAFRAVDYQEKCEEYLKGQLEMLKFYNIENLSGASKQWFCNPSVYVLIVEDIITHTLVGGIRLHLYHPDHRFPLVEAVQHLDPKILNLEAKGNAEASGLWVDHNTNGLRGLKIVLSKAILALSHQLEVINFYALSAPHVLKLFCQLGLRVIKNFGKEGDILYPNPNYTSTFLHIDTRTFENTSPKDRDEIFSLSANPIQTRVNEEGDSKLVVNYELIRDASRHITWAHSAFLNSDKAKQVPEGVRSFHHKS